MSKRTYTYEELRDLAAQHGIEVKPPAPPKPRRSKPDPDTSKLRAAIERRQKAKTRKPATTAARDLPKTTIHYVRNGATEEYNPKTDQWIERTEAYWQRQARYGGPARFLEVGDVDGPTVIEDQTYGPVVARGCGVCGFKECVRPSSPIKLRKLNTTLCVRCHIEWTRLPLAERKDLAKFVTKRLREEGYIDPSVPEFETIQHSETHSEQKSLVLTTWRKYLWASRVLNSVEPESQEPVSRPFAYLAGPIEVAQEVQR